MYTDADVENTPFGESMYGGVTSRRPLMLIEPAYKINGEDKSKSQNRASKPTAEQENKGSSPKSKETSSPDPKAPVSDTNKVLEETVAKPVTKVVSKPATTTKDTETSGTEKPKGKRSGSTIKSPKTDETDSSTSSSSRSALEENIVLGVALEGSKRTLPIEEEIHSSSMETDAKELSGARRSGGKGPLVADKEQKDGQSQPNSGASTEQ